MIESGVLPALSAAPGAASDVEAHASEACPRGVVRWRSWGLLPAATPYWSAFSSGGSWMVLTEERSVGVTSNASGGSTSVGFARTAIRASERLPPSTVLGLDSTLSAAARRLGDELRGPCRESNGSGIGPNG